MTKTDVPSQKESIRADFWLLLALFLVFRLLTLFLLKPGGFIRDWSDFDTYLGIARLSDFGLYPYLHFWLEWPPVVPWLMVGAYRLSLLVPVWSEDPRLWFVTILGSVFVLFEAGNFWLVYRLARRLFAARADILRVLAMYALLFPPIYAMLGFFDGIALFFILLSFELLLADRIKWAGVAAAVGALVKLTPVVTAGVAAWLIWHRLKPDWRQVVRGWLGYGVSLLGTATILLLPFLLTAPQWLTAHARAVLGRSSWETVWAVLEGYFGFGQLAGDRLNPAETVFAVHPASLPWLWISLAFAAIYLLAFFARPKDTSPRRVLAFGGLTIVLFLLYSKGYSPQFLVLILPFIVLLLPNWAGVGYALTLTALNVLEQPVYFVMLPDAHWLLSAVVWLRFAVFVALAVEFGVQSFRFQVLSFGQRSAKSQSPIANNQSPISNLRIAFFAIVFLWMIALLPRAATEYRAAQLAKLSDGGIISFLQSVGETSPQELIVTNPDDYQKIYSFLHRQFRVKLVDHQSFLPEDFAQHVATSVPAAWVLTAENDSTGEGSAGRKLATRGRIVAEYLPGQGGRLLLMNFSGATIAPPVLASAENGIELAAAAVKKESGTLTAQLFWHATAPPGTNFTVFTQLLSADGQYFAGHDGPPANGGNATAGWDENALVFDPHAIELPADLPPGDYRLVVGMYDASGTRLPFFAPDGTPFADGAIPAQTIHLP